MPTAVHCWSDMWSHVVRGHIIYNLFVIMHVFSSIINDGSLPEEEEKKTKKLKRNFVRSYLGNVWSDFLQIWCVDSPCWPAPL